MDVHVHTRLGQRGFVYATVSFSEAEWHALPGAESLDEMAYAADNMSHREARALYLFFKGLENAISKAVAQSAQAIPPRGEEDVS